MIDIFDVTLPALTGAETRRAYVYLPEAAGDGDRRFPVLYMFDGHNVFFDEDATYGKSWGLGEYLDAFEVPLIVAAVECNHGEDNARLKEYAPYSFSALGFGSIEGRGPRTMDWLVHVFKPGIDRDYPTLPDREHTFIAGSSMGGLMTLFALAAYGDTFSRGAALSPSVDFSPEDVKRMVRGARWRDKVLYMDMGSAEMSRKSRSVYGEVTSLLIRRSAQVESRIIPGGVHSEASWERQIPFFLDTLFYELEI